MVYRKRNYGYRKRYRKRYYKRRGGGTRRRISKVQRMCNDISASATTASTVASAAYKALSIASSIAGVINVEQKSQDGAYDSASIDSSGVFDRVTDLAQGLTEAERIGDKILMKSLYIKMRISRNTAGSSRQTLRVVVLVDKECDGVAPVYSNVYATAETNALLNNDADGRYVILKDRTYQFVDGAKELVDSKLFIPLNIHCKYDGATAAIGDAKQNQVYIMLISNSASNGPGISTNYRLKWTDN